VARWCKLGSVVEELRKLRGRYCWGVRAGDHALLTLELGPPMLEVVESPEGREVTARGRAQLAIVEAFELEVDGRRYDARSEDLDEGLARLSGQALMVVAEGELRFDLGAVLRFAPTGVVLDGE